MVWLIMGVLNWLPDWGIHLIVFVGGLGLLVTHFPRVLPLTGVSVLPIKIVSVLLLVVGVWLEGGRGVERVWEARVAELEAKVAISEARSQEANKQLSEAIQTKQKFTREIQGVLQARITQARDKIDAGCRVDSEAIKILNDAARNVKGIE